VALCRLGEFDDSSAYLSQQCNTFLRFIKWLQLLGQEGRYCPHICLQFNKASWVEVNSQELWMIYPDVLIITFKM
jgi:hypothetical protein